MAALIICGATRADKVMVKGKLLIDDGKLVHVNMDKLYLEHKKAQQALFI